MAVKTRGGAGEKNGVRSEKEIYRVLENRLRETSEPITCVDLMDNSEFRAIAMAEYGKDVRVTTNKVSDALGLMWRRGLLIKYPAPRATNTLVRYAYIWDKAKDTASALPVPSPTSSKVATDIGDPHAAQQLLGHQNISMTEDYIKQRQTDEVMPARRKE